MSITQYLRQSKQSETLLINQLSLHREQSQQRVYKLGFGQSPFPVPEKVTAALAENAHRKEYMNVQGHFPLRQAVCDFHKQLETRHWSADEVIIGPGSKILLYCLMASFIEAEVLLPAPSWVSYEPQGHLAGHKVHWLATGFEDDWKITAQQIEAFCNSRSKPEVPLILVLNYPSNPTGQTYGQAELKVLAEALRKHNVIVIADEIYAFLQFDNNTTRLEHFYPERTITTSGLSKWCGAGGWRIGYARIPKSLQGLMETAIGVASETYSCAPAPMQIAATQAYVDSKPAMAFQQQQIAILKQIANFCSDALTAVGVNVAKSQGGFYLFPDFSPFTEALAGQNISTSQQLTAVIMEQTGVALLPGSAFGMSDTSLTARLAYVDFDGGKALQDLDNLQVMSHLKEGINKLCDWLNKL